jgi:hypothetical protein
MSIEAEIINGNGKDVGDARCVPDPEPYLSPES